MSKTPITHVSAIGIIYPESDPRQILMEIKDDGHKRPTAQRGLSHIGGNWSGPEAMSDKSPSDTFRRSVRRELALTHQLARPVRLAELPGIPEGEFLLKPNVITSPTKGDEEALDMVKEAICNAARPYDAFLNTEPDGEHALVTIWMCGLTKDAWQMLTELITKFGNISGEGVLVLTSLDEMVETQHPSAFGINIVLADFWNYAGQDQGGREINTLPKTLEKWIGPVSDDYAELAEQFDINPTAISP